VDARVLTSVKVTLVVDALAPPLAGIGRYTCELCKRLPAQGGVEQVSHFANGRFLENPADFIHSKRWPSRRVPRFIRRRLIERRLQSSLVHGPNYFLPPEAESGIITVHDLSVLRFPDTHPVARRREFERKFESSLRRAAHVLTDTETVRREVIADLGVPEDKVTAIHLGVDPQFRPRSGEELRPQLAQLGLVPGGYALCVSTLEPRKKIAELLRAWDQLPRRLRESTPLVLAGGKGWLNEALHEQIRGGVEAGWLIHLGFVPEPLLPALFAGSSLFLYPSIYEGFGLPPVEAMASGVPVIVADSSCLPEVCGDAAAYVEPDDIDGFEAAIARALTDSGWRESARTRGLRRAACFNWDRCASETVGIYLGYGRWSAT
jgi:glycosyltransferase involved in cell wall biosynthesis